MSPARAGPVERLLLQQLVCEIERLDGADRVAKILRSIGGELAALIPLQGGEGASALEGEINAVWRPLDLGAAEIAAHRTGLVIVHRLPDAGQGFAACLPRRAFWALIEGWYERWLNALAGGAASLVTTCRRLDAREAEFWHGL